MGPTAAFIAGQKMSTTDLPAEFVRRFRAARLIAKTPRHGALFDRGMWK